MRKGIVYAVAFGTLLLVAAIARTHVCSSSYLHFLNLTGDQVQVNVVDDKGEYFLWSGWISPHTEPLQVRPVNNTNSYFVFVQDKEGAVIAEDAFGYDERWLRNHNFFILLDDRILFTSWPLGKTLPGNLFYMLKAVLGDTISCPLLMVGLSPKTIPETMSSTIKNNDIVRLQRKLYPDH